MISSRSLRNNNPLNIRRGKDQWKGLRAQQEDAPFCQSVALAMAMFEGGLSDATPLIIPMLRGWANMVRE